MKEAGTQKARETLAKTGGAAITPSKPKDCFAETQHSSNELHQQGETSSAQEQNKTRPSCEAHLDHQPSCEQSKANDPNAQPRGLSAFPLKMLAIVAMTFNHASYIFGDVLSTPLLCLFNGVGGLTFPLMAFLLVEGYRHTSNIRKYATRLLVFALIAQVPFSLFLDHRGNVLFTLLISLAILYFDDYMPSRSAFWASTAALISLSSPCDWGLLGPAMILIMKRANSRRERIVYPLLLPMLSMGVPALLAFMLAGDPINLATFFYGIVGCGSCIPLLYAYNGQRGCSLKYFFYCYYPAHIAILGALAKLLG